LLGSGTILREVEAAAEILQQDFAVAADVWSVTSFTELRREGMRVDRENLLHADKPAKTCWVQDCLKDAKGPVITATDHMKLQGDLIRPWISQRYVVLGTDGFGRSDSRQKLRQFFEVDRHFIVLAALKALADEGQIEGKQVVAAMKKFGIDASKPYPPLH